MRLNLSLKKTIKNGKKMNIFLSYGHDENEVLVQHIKRDLEARGYDVWIDKEKIDFGDDWRSAITEGIMGSDWVLSFLSKYSAREPGVCLDELAIALGVKGGIVNTVLVESEQEVTPPVSVSHIQWLDMHDWKDHWNKNSNLPIDDGWYAEKIAEIIRVIESDANRKFAGEIDLLNRKLKPISPDTRIAELLKQGFVGREWLAQDIDRWLYEKKDSRVFLLVGEPGVGKSAFAAWLAHQNKANIIAAYYLEYNKPAFKHPKVIVTSIAFQIATRLPDYRKFLLNLPDIDNLGEKNAAELFVYLIAEPLQKSINGNRARYAVLIDAMDEASEDGRETLADLIAQESRKLPEWVTFIITSRPYQSIMRKLSHLEPLEINADDKRNRKDLAEFIRKWMIAAKMEGNVENIANAVVTASEGNFLYVRKFREGVKDHWIDIEDTQRYPQGMTGMYEQYFRRQMPEIDAYENNQVPLLELIVAGYEPIPEELAGKILGWTGRDKVRTLEPLDSLFQRKNDVIAPFHKSMKDWLTDDRRSGQYHIDAEKGHQILAEHAWRQYQADVSTMSPYLKNHIVQHLIRTKQYERVVELLKNIHFMQEKYLSSIKYDVVHDYVDAVDCFLSTGENDRLNQITAFLLNILTDEKALMHAENTGISHIHIVMDIAVALVDFAVMNEPVKKIIATACRHNNMNVRSMGILTLMRIKRKGDLGYNVAISVLRDLAGKAVCFGVPIPKLFEAAAITALGLFLEDPSNKKLQKDLRTICRVAIRRIILLKPFLWAMTKIAVKIMANVPNDYNVINIKEIVAFKKLLTRNDEIRKAVEEIVAHIDPSYGDDNTFHMAWKSYIQHILANQEGFLYVPLTVAFLNRALTGSEKALEDIYECFQDLKASQKLCAYDAHYRMQMIQLGRRLSGQGPLPAEWVGRVEEILLENYRKGFRPQGLDEYIGGFGGAINTLVRHTGNPQIPLLDAMIQKSLQDKEAQIKEGIPRVKQRDMIIARELEINGIETGAYDPLVRGWVFYGLTCFLTRREMLDEVLWQKLSVLGRKIWLYYPQEFREALERLDKRTVDEFMSLIKNAKAESNLGELISAKTETYCAMVYCEPIGSAGAMRPRMMKFLQSLFSADPLEATMKKLLTMLFVELLSADGEERKFQ